MAENKKTEATAKAQDKKGKKPSFLDKVKGFFGRIVKYFKDTKSELKKVVCPSRKDGKTNTVTVIIVVIIAAVVLILLDLIFGGVIQLMIGA